MQKKQKLLVQVSMIVTAIFFGAVIYTAVSDYYITRRTYLSSKNEMLDRDLRDMRTTYYDLPSLKWLFQFLEEHPEREIDGESSQAEIERMNDPEFAQIYAGYFDDHTVRAENLDPVDQMLLQADALHILAHGLVYGDKSNYDRISLLDIQNAEESYLLLDYHSGQNETVRGGRIPYPASQHSAVAKILAGEIKNLNQSVQEVYRSPEDGKFYYIDYLPVGEEGEIAGYLCIWYDWSEFNRELIRNSLSSIVIGFVVMLLLNGLLILFLYYQAIAPLAKVEDAVVGYMQDKNSNEVTEKIQEVKVRNEIGVLADSFSALATEIDRYTGEIRTLTEEKTRISAELNVATSIQEDMLPRIFPAFPNRREFDLFADMDPAKEVGGDFYDFFLLDDDHLGVVMADVSGKGVPAALFMVIAKTLIKNRALMGGTPGEVLAYVNNQLCENNASEFFVTVWFAIIEISTGKVISANAGHEHPALCRKGGQYEFDIYPHSPAVAIMAGVSFKEREFQLNPGDRFYVYTDGVPEATDLNKELFGPDRLLQALNQNPNADPREIIAAVKTSIDEFVGEAPQFDDTTMMAFTYFGPEDSKGEAGAQTAE